MSLDALMMTAAKKALTAAGIDDADATAAAESALVDWVDGLKPADYLGIIADCVGRLPHGDDVDRPCLNLGTNADAYAAVVPFKQESMGILTAEFVSARVGCMWIEAGKPRGGAL